jgi:hypothetical protein
VQAAPLLLSIHKFTPGTPGEGLVKDKQFEFTPGTLGKAGSRLLAPGVLG